MKGEHCPYSGMPANVENARDPGGPRQLLRVVCPYCGKEVAVSWADSCFRKHNKPS